MSKVLTFSRTFPSYHPKKGQDTFFPEMILSSLGVKINDVYNDDRYSAFRGIVNDFALMDGSKKNHTIRAGNRWKEGDWFSPRVWSDKPYASKQIIIAPDVQLKKVWPIKIHCSEDIVSILINDKYVTKEQLEQLALNDGLTVEDLISWFSKSMIGQILCWNENISDY